MIKGASELLQKLLLLILLAPAPDFLLLILLRWNTALICFSANIPPPLVRTSYMNCPSGGIKSTAKHLVTKGGMLRGVPSDGPFVGLRRKKRNTKSRRRGRGKTSDEGDQGKREGDAVPVCVKRTP